MVAEQEYAGGSGSISIWDRFLEVLSAPETARVLEALGRSALLYEAYPRLRPPRMLSGLCVAWGGLEQALAELLCEWSPDSTKNERANHLKLQSFLQQRAPGAIIQRNARVDAGIPDLILEWPGFFGRDAVRIELKAHLRSSSEFKRAVGQVLDYHLGDHKVILVICGDTPPEHVKHLEELLNEKAPSPFADASIRIVDRTISALQIARRQEERRRQAALRQLARMQESPSR